MAMVEPVAKEACNERHRLVEDRQARDERRLNAHGERLDTLERASDVQAKINEQLMQQLDTLVAWKETVEKKPLRRIGQIIDVVTQWGTLALLAWLAARLGLGV